MNYYNEFDPGAAACLRALISEGLIPKGEVDERSIVEVQPEDLKGFNQCHFFAGIGGWSLALRLAGWPDDRPCWTGSCPCQPFSAAGSRRGTDDERHLWPAFFRLIDACLPEVVFGEQVASADVVGRANGSRTDGGPAAWLDGVFDDLEAASYACFAVDLPAACVGSPHIRQRLFWVADAASPRQAGREDGGASRGDAGQRIRGIKPERSGDVRGLADSTDGARDGSKLRNDAGAHGGEFDGLADSEHSDRRAEHQKHGEAHGRNGLGRRRHACGMGNADCGRLGEGEAVPRCPATGVGVSVASDWIPVVFASDCDDEGNCHRCGIDYAECGCPGPTQEDEFEYEERADGLFARRLVNTDDPGCVEHSGAEPVRPQFASAERAGRVDWNDSIAVACRDGKARRIPSQAQPVLFGVADGLPGGVDPLHVASLGHPLAEGKIEGRVGLLRGFGNAIVPQVAAEFVKAFMRVKGIQ